MRTEAELKLDYELVSLAQRFYREVETPSEDDMETLFFMLVRRDFDGLHRLLSGSE